MGTFLRIHDPFFTHFVTNRCEHELFLLLPQKEANRIILFWLAKAHRLLGKDIEIYAFIFMSNHFHLLLRDPYGQLARFMCYFQGNVARSLNRLHGRSGKFWGREYDDVIVDGEDEFCDRFAYTKLNAVKSGLVATPAQWKGVESYSYLMNNQPIVATGLNLSAYNDARRHGRKAKKEDFEETFSFNLAVPPMLQKKTLEERVVFYRNLFEGAKQKYRKDRLYKPFMGMKKVLAQSPFGRPEKVKRGPRFKFMSFCKKRRGELQKMYQDIVEAYRRVVNWLFLYFDDNLFEKHQYIDTNLKLPWPKGTYPPCKHRPAGCV